METFKPKFVSNVYPGNFVPEMSEEDLKILDRCIRLFMKYGVKSLTMDDIAGQLGMSKKTLYQYFENKEDLVIKATEHHFRLENQAILGLCAHSSNAIDEMLNISQWISAQMQGINPVLIFDLKKHHPKAWHLFEQHRNSDVYRCILHNLQRGVQEGLYRSDMCPDIIARSYIGRMEVVIDPELFPPDQFGFAAIHKEFIHYHIRGIASSKGLKYLETIQNQPHVS